MAQAKETISRNFKGEVVSTKMLKTIVVKVERTKTHPIYTKQYTVSKKFKVHAPTDEYKVGDIVLFTETRPLSKDKRWRVIKKVK